jgi:hypothetical protein
MAVVPGFRHDVFVSYAHADDIPVAGTEVGLVSGLVADLRTEVGRKLNTGIDIWWDHYKLAGNIPVTPEIMTAAGDCASIVVVVSAAYLRSEWCNRERGLFLDLLDRRQSGAAGAVFMVIIDPVDHGSLPPRLRDLTGYSFYRTTGSGRATRPLRTEFTQDKEPYYDQLAELAHNISDYLESLIPKAAPARGDAAAPAGVVQDGKPCVLLMEVTDDLVQRRAETKGYLEQSGIVVLPEKRYSRDDMEVHRSQILADLKRSRACVQILGPLAGDRGDHPRGLAWLRYETVRDSGASIPFIQWRDPDLSLESVTDQDAHELIVPASVRTDRFPDFRRALAELALKPPERLPPSGARDVVSVFVNSDLLDRGFAVELSRWLESSGFMVLEPPQSTEDAREEWETNLRYCDSLLLVYGQTKPSWVRTQLLLSNKVQRETPLRLLSVCIAPPGDAVRDKVQELALRYAGIHYVHNEASLELNQSELTTFAARLRGMHA